MSAFHHDGEDFWDVMDASAAQREAEESISRWRPVDGEGEGWPVEFVERVAWGLTVQMALPREEGAACLECGEHLPSMPEVVEWLDGRPIVAHVDSCGAPCGGEVVPTAEYELRDVPDLAERIAEVLSTRPAVWEQVRQLMGAR